MNLDTSKLRLKSINQLILLKFIYFSLGAVHDGTGVAVNCTASSNNMMTAVIGLYSNAQNLFFFSNCSVNSFKKLLNKYGLYMWEQ